MLSSWFYCSQNHRYPNIRDSEQGIVEGSVF